MNFLRDPGYQFPSQAPVVSIAINDRSSHCGSCHWRWTIRIFIRVKVDLTISGLANEWLSHGFRHSIEWLQSKARGHDAELFKPTSSVCLHGRCFIALPQRHEGAKFAMTLCAPSRLRAFAVRHLTSPGVEEHSPYFLLYHRMKHRLQRLVYLSVRRAPVRPHPQYPSLQLSHHPLL